jgi:hypothetical protein
MDENKKRIWKTIINFIITVLTALLTTIGAHAANLVD